jgi:hypothetical protein
MRDLNMESSEVVLVVNGAAIELNPFANRVIGNTILGLVNSLRLDSSPQVIEIKVTATKPSLT